MPNRDEEELPSEKPQRAPTQYIRCPHCEEMTMKAITRRIWQCEGCKYQEHR